MTDLDSALASIEKQFGKGSIGTMSSRPMDVEAISTGCMAIDLALGVGGLPKGRVTEIYGPESSGKTTLAMHVVAEAQRNGGICAYIDAEHAMDPVYAEAVGVDVDELLISQPDNAEQALEIANTLIKSNSLAVIVIDSVAALTPRAEIEGEMGDSHVGLQARLMSQAMRKITHNLNKSNTVCIFINQIREKIGVMFGCGRGDEIIPFTDGTSSNLRDVVENKIKKKVWGYDSTTGEIVERSIVGWFNNGRVNSHSDWIHIKATPPDTANGTGGLILTPDHKVMTESGWKPAKDISTNDRLMSRFVSIINGSLGEFMAGVLMGDSHIASSGKYNGYLQLEDSNDPDYLNWKLSKLTALGEFKECLVPNRSMDRSYVRYVTKPSYELGQLRRILAGRQNIENLMGNFSALSMAILYMDDGHLGYSEKGAPRPSISMKRFKGGEPEGIQMLTKWLHANGIEASWQSLQGNLYIRHESTDTFFELIRPYVPECMNRKLPDWHRGFYNEFTLDYSECQEVAWVDVTSVGPATFRSGWLDKYDIEVQGCHSFLAGNSQNGFLVHNSPETTPGGRALKFYSSVRIDIRRIESIKEGVEVVGNRTRTKIVKNKVAPPFKQAEFDIVYGKGINGNKSLLEVAVEYGIVDKSGAWFSFNGDQIGQGIKNTSLFLEENPDVFQRVKDNLESHLASLAVGS